jgi:hypothetical protein
MNKLFRFFIIAGGATLLANQAPAQGVTQERTASDSPSSLSSARGVGRTMREIQSRHGGILENKLSQLCQELVVWESEAQKYFKNNPTRFGALVYACASGVSGDKTVRLVYYAKEGDGNLFGQQFSKIKKWVFDPLIAETLAGKAAQALGDAGAGEFTVTTNFNTDLIEVTFYPAGGSLQTEPIVGESVSFR